MHNNTHTHTRTHKCTRNEGKACKQLIYMHNKAHCYRYWALLCSFGIVLYNFVLACAQRARRPLGDHAALLSRMLSRCCSNMIHTANFVGFWYAMYSVV